MESSDADIVRRVRAGDVAAFGAIVERYYERCLRYCMRMLANRADAEEATQDVFAKAYRYLDSYEERSSFSGWIMRVAVNEVRTTAARRQRTDTPLVPLDAAAEFASPAGSVDAHLAADVQRALDRLDAPSRELIVLKYVNDLTYESMAEITGLAVPTLKMRLFRARERLGALLERLYDD